MRLPFTISKTYTSSLSAEELTGIIREKLRKQSKLLFISSNDYGGWVKGSKFKIYRNFNVRFGRANPVIKGIISTENPTIIDIRIIPHYFRICFFLIFPMVFIPMAISIPEMKINGVLRTPEIWERLLFCCFGGGGPLIWCYFDSIQPIKGTERWIRQQLQLNEMM